MLNLGYPGGVFVSKMADEFACKNPNHKNTFNLPKPMLHKNNYDFSFSGLKTAVLYLIQDLKKEGKFSKKIIPQICFEAQEVICDVLVAKTLKLAKDIDAKTIMISGGVSANNRLRQKFQQSTKDIYTFVAPDKKMSTDNAVMIALAGYHEHLSGKKDDCLTLEVNPNLQILN